VHFGKIGTNGQVKDKACGSVEEATAEVEKLIKEKVKKGYVEKTK
jgi:predicted DNA-binding WGR domain protein